MKNSQKSLVVSLFLVIIVLVIGGGVYVYKTKKVEVPALIGNTTQQSDKDQNVDSQNGNVTPTPTIQDNLSLSKIITVISPSAGSVLQVGKPHKITWSGIYERGDEVFEIDLFSVGSDTYDTIAEVPIAEASCIGGRTMSRWGDLSTCSYVWTPKSSVQKMQIRINNKSKGGQSGSSGVFSINHTDTSLLQPAVTIVSPNGDEKLKVGESFKIKWMSNVRVVSRAVLYLLSGSKCPPGYHCTPLPNTMAVIAKLDSTSANLGSYEWIVNTSNVKDYGNGYYMKVVLFDDSGKTFVDESDSYFSII